LILVDAGPLVALIHADDRYHASCKEALKKIREPLGTVWPAFTEAMYLLGFSNKAQDSLWRLVESEAFKILALDAADAPRMRDLMRKYRDLPMDLADAALVRVAEREKIARVFTIDRRDFEVYRPRGLPRFTILP
jgi:predicted nucleic acid-binding protein